MPPTPIPPTSADRPAGLLRPVPGPAVALTTLAERCGAVLGGAGGDGPAVDDGDRSAVGVHGVTMSSALTVPGDLFAGVPGRFVHGASFAPEAVAAGAVAVLTDVGGLAFVPPGVPTLQVPDVRAVLGPVAAEIYGNPSREMEVIGVTGTSGKTTTAYLVRAGLQAAKVESGLVGTVATLIGDEAVTTGFTTPEAPQVQALLAVMRERGARTVAMEVSSHALAMGRADGIEFAVAAFTNLSQDHLDFHADMADYFAAKARLFDGRARQAIVVTDDDWGRRMAELAGPGTVTVNTTGGTTGGDSAQWRAVDVRTTPGGGTEFGVLSPRGEFTGACAVPGAYNVANALLALAILDAVGVSPAVAGPAVAQASVPGRMERIEAGQPFLAVVDYSHKPAAIDGALRALRPLTRGRLIVVLGCGGDRDTGKRPHMGEIAARGAELLVVTDDNPRSEDPATIRRAMLDGAFAVPVADRGEILEIGDRAEAIAHAVAVARPGDTVLLAGKGHESGQEIAGTVHPFDDRVVLRRALERQA